MHIVRICWCEPDVVGWTGRVEFVDERRVSSTGLAVVEEVSIRAGLTVTGYASGGVSCNGPTGPDGNLLYNSQSSGGNTAFINYLNSASPANYIWFTPTDSHNMHDNSVSTGDAYLQTLLVGTGTLSSPSATSVLGSSLLKTPGTFLYLWWDEYDPSPNVEYGSMIKVGYTSTVGYTEYKSLHT